MYHEPTIFSKICFSFWEVRYVYVSAGVCGGGKRASDPLESEVAVSRLTQVLETELKTCATAVCALYPQAISLVPELYHLQESGRSCLVHTYCHITIATSQPQSFQNQISIP